MIVDAVPPAFLHALGWILIHALWQGALLAALASLLFYHFRRSDPRVRYAIGCGVLLLMLVAPVTTLVVSFDVLQNEASVPAWTVADEAAVVMAAPSPHLEPLTLPQTFPVLDTPDAPWWTALNPLLPAFVWVWMIGVLVLTIRHVGGWSYGWYMRRSLLQPLNDEWTARLQALRHKLGVRTSVHVMASDHIQVPFVIGWWRPIIVLPLSALTGLSVHHIEAILAHELAHVRRYDYAVNLIQTAIETLLFFNPAVWWVSQRIRVEREQCCDDIAVQASGSPQHYIRALLQLEDLRPTKPTLALAATDGPLLQRVQRLLGMAPTSPSLRWPTSALAILLTGLFLSWSAYTVSADTPLTWPDLDPRPVDAAFYVEHTVPTRSGGRLLVDVPGFHLQIQARPVDVATVYFHVSGPDLEAAQLLYDLSKVNVEADAEGFSVTADWPRDLAGHSWNYFSNARITARIVVPETYDADLKTLDGSIWADGLNGTFNLRTSDGPIYLGSLSGPTIRIRSDNSPIYATHLSADSISVYTAESPITLGASGEVLRVSNTAGPLSIQLFEAMETSLSSWQGDVRLWTPDALSATLDLQGAHIALDPALRFDGESSARRLQGLLNGGGLSIRARSRTGHISVQQSTR